MDTKQFWSLIEELRKDADPKEYDKYLRGRNKRLKALLGALTPQEIVDFRRILEEKAIETFRWDLWAAAAVISDGASKDGFKGFRLWLVSQGKATFDAALRDPETLADNIEARDHDTAEFQGFTSIVFGAYKDKTKKALPEPDVELPEEPSGKAVTREVRHVDKSNIHALTTRFPRLVETFTREHWHEKEPQEPEYTWPTKSAIAPMPEDRFWSFIEASRREAARGIKPGDREYMERQMAAMTDVLRGLEPDDIVAFQRRFDELTGKAHRFDLWGAAYWLGGGCGDDGFYDFRSTLISLGKEMFEQALKDPDSLADMVGRPDVPYLQAEGFQYLTTPVYKEKTGFDGLPEWPDYEGGSHKAAGHHFNFDDKALMQKHYPRLLAKWPKGQ